MNHFPPSPTQVKPRTAKYLYMGQNRRQRGGDEAAKKVDDEEVDGRQAAVKIPCPSTTTRIFFVLNKARRVASWGHKDSLYVELEAAQPSWSDKNEYTIFNQQPTSIYRKTCSSIVRIQVSSFSSDMASNSYTLFSSIYRFYKRRRRRLLCDIGAGLFPLLLAC